MKRYVFKINQMLTTKNKLEDAISTLIKKYNNKVVKAGNLEDFKSKIIRELKELNNQHKRSRPKQVEFWIPNYNKNKHQLVGLDVLSASFDACEDFDKEVRNEKVD